MKKNYLFAILTIIITPTDLPYTKVMGLVIEKYEAVLIKMLNVTVSDRFSMECLKLAAK